MQKTLATGTPLKAFFCFLASTLTTTALFAKDSLRSTLMGARCATLVREYEQTSSKSLTVLDHEYFNYFVHVITEKGSPSFNLDDHLTRNKNYLLSHTRALANHFNNHTKSFRIKAKLSTNNNGHPTIEIMWRKPTSAESSDSLTPFEQIVDQVKLDSPWIKFIYDPSHNFEFGAMGFFKPDENTILLSHLDLLAIDFIPPVLIHEASHLAMFYEKLSDSPRKNAALTSGSISGKVQWAKSIYLRFIKGFYVEEFYAYRASYLANLQNLKLRLKQTKGVIDIAVIIFGRETLRNQRHLANIAEDYMQSLNQIADYIEKNKTSLVPAQKNTYYLNIRTTEQTDDPFTASLIIHHDELVAANNDPLTVVKNRIKRVEASSMKARQRHAQILDIIPEKELDILMLYPLKNSAIELSQFEKVIRVLTSNP